ncbi:hypothetical protein [Aneurinibacillus danicus]|uniref:Uncharacterized protein n=1 Tax=Aneurinibacillus danicus TaxID=267746 RepID=A0A511VAH6_9BACL|nr:hypothetical protein [Aneurinibacillus danicus]GEN35925.1 hypothetical protein ADA01nite_33850 [Aneurinibacillus danicus]
MKFYRIAEDGRHILTQKREEAAAVFMDIEELEKMERTIRNKTEEAERWRKKLTGEGLEWKITRVIIHVYSSNYHVFMTVPVPHQLHKEQEAKDAVVKRFGHILNNLESYRLYFTPAAGWVLYLELYPVKYEILKKEMSIG